MKVLWVWRTQKVNKEKKHAIAPILLQLYMLWTFFWTNFFHEILWKNPEDIWMVILRAIFIRVPYCVWPVCEFFFFYFFLKNSFWEIYKTLSNSLPCDILKRVEKSFKFCCLSCKISRVKWDIGWKGKKLTEFFLHPH